MTAIEYTISLRIRHPNFDPDVISENLRLSPRHSWRAGTPRTDPAGNLLEGKNRETYWTHRYVHPDGIELGEFIERIVARLNQHEEFLHTLIISGGEVELFVGWFSPANSGELFSWQLMRKLGELKVNLAFDIYGNKIDK